MARASFDTIVPVRRRFELAPAQNANRGLLFMSYQVLARKYRPKDFESVVGQEPVVRALTHALRENRLHHAYLFTGTRGVGKTTLSRILAKCLNCVGPDGKGGVTDHPCGVCPACRAIDEGHFVDYIEMDAASNRSVEEMTELLEQAMYAPTNARYKVYMIDEVHQLTTHAFNAMLKTLEEPPEYVKFILATTDPQKVPVTVLSRCLQFNLRNVAPQVIAGHLANVMQKESLEAEPAALKLIGTAAKGSIRDALSLLDQAIAYAGDDPVTLESVRGMLGVMDSDILAQILEKMAADDASGVMKIADSMALEGVSFSEALQSMAVLLHKIAMAQKVPEAFSRDDADYGNVKKLSALFSPEEVQLFYQIVLYGRSDLHLAPDEYSGFTMTLLRMMAFKPAGQATSALPDRTLKEGEPRKEGPSGPFESAALSGESVQKAAAVISGAVPATLSGAARTDITETAGRVPEVKPAAAVKNETPAPWEAEPAQDGALPKERKQEMGPADLPGPELDGSPEDISEDDPEDFPETDFPTEAPPEAFEEYDAKAAQSAAEETDTEPEALFDQYDAGPRDFTPAGKMWFEKMRDSFAAGSARLIIEKSECVSIAPGAVRLRIEPFYEPKTKNEAAMRLLRRIVDNAFGQKMKIDIEFSAPQSRTIDDEKRSQAPSAPRKAFRPLTEAEAKSALSALKSSPTAKILARRFGGTLLDETFSRDNS